MSRFSKNAVILGLFFCFIFSFTFGSAVSWALAGEKKITLALTTEPPNLDASKATDAESFFVLGHTMEGLTRYDKQGKIAPGVAEKWELNDKTAKFTLNKNAKWSDGKPVTAKDFVFSWQRALDPKTASEYAFILYPIKNGEAINKGEKQAKDLGVVAKDDYTLEVTFEKPCGHFLGLVSFPTYYPQREEFVKPLGETYASGADKLLYNGAFKLTNWVHGASLKMQKNPFYWRASEIQIDEIDVPYITPDDSARFNLFKTQKIDFLSLSKENLINAQREKFKLNRFSDGTLFYIQMNFRDGRVTKNHNLRKALQMVMNLPEFVSRVIGIPGTEPAYGLIPSWMMGEKQLFRKEFPVPVTKPNVVEAKKALALALKELGLTSPPPLVWLTGDAPISTKEAEYFQNLFKTTLGIELKIDKQIFKQRLAKMTEGDSDIVSAGWGPDYADPLTFADLFASWNGNNRGLWKNTQYDEAIRKAMNTTQTKVRMKAFAEAEKILLSELPIIPLFERSTMYTHSPKIEGIGRRAVGFDPDYTNAKIK